MVETALPPFSSRSRIGAFRIGLELQVLPGRRGAGQDENAGADDGSDTKGGQAPRTQRLAQLPVGLLGGGDQRIDAAGPKEPGKSIAPPLRAACCTRGR